jgi:hypothetical protein
MAYGYGVPERLLKNEDVSSNSILTIFTHLYDDQIICQQDSFHNYRQELITSFGNGRQPADLYFVCQRNDPL